MGAKMIDYFLAGCLRLRMRKDAWSTCLEYQTVPSEHIDPTKLNTYSDLI